MQHSSSWPVSSTSRFETRGCSHAARAEPSTGRSRSRRCALADVVRGIDLSAATPEHVAGRELALHAAPCANASLDSDRSLSVTVLIAQVRSLVQDLLIAIGLEEENAPTAIDAA